LSPHHSGESFGRVINNGVSVPFARGIAVAWTEASVVPGDDFLLLA